jgi:hypothetical protein
MPLQAMRIAVSTPARRNPWWVMHILPISVCICALGLACSMSVREPKQNDKYTLSPAHYGETYFDGLRAPEEIDGGVGEIEPSKADPVPPQGDATHSRRRRPHAKPQSEPASSSPPEEPAEPAEPAEPPAKSREIFID